MNLYNKVALGRESCREIYSFCQLSLFLLMIPAPTLLGMTMQPLHKYLGENK